MMSRENIAWGQLDSFQDIVEHSFEYKNTCLHKFREIHFLDQHKIEWEVVMFCCLPGLYSL